MTGNPAPSGEIETKPHPRRVASANLPTKHGDFRIHIYCSAIDGVEHAALVAGDVSKAGGEAPVLARLHSECLTGDVFGSSRCDCGEQLDLALARIADEGRGVLIYLRGQEGRGIGLTHKIEAYRLQDNGMDTVDANLAQGLPVDSRSYDAAAYILHDLGINSVRLMSNNPLKVSALAEAGIEVAERVSHYVRSNPHNFSYLKTKRDRMGHVLKMLDQADSVK